MSMEFGIPDAVTILPGNGDLPKVRLTHSSGALAEIYPHGAHITSWQTKTGKELLFLSSNSNFAAHQPIRGGIPVIFPQFGAGTLPPHGFARITDWEISHSTLHDSGDVEVAMQLWESEDSFNIWQHHFILELTARLSEDKLSVGLMVSNTGDEPFLYHVALHSYFAVEDIHRTAVRGLEGTTYLDWLREDVREVETRAHIRFEEETDRVYIHAPDMLQINDEAHQRSVFIEKCHMPDVVIWNPWIDKSRRLSDFGDEEYLNMICVETGNIAKQAALIPGDTYRGETIFSFAAIEVGDNLPRPELGVVVGR